jgi:putative solute:sodium symporter small subunit
LRTARPEREVERARFRAGPLSLGAAHNACAFGAPAVVLGENRLLRPEKPVYTRAQSPGPRSGHRLHPARRSNRSGRPMAKARLPHDEASGAPGGREAAGIPTVLRQEERFMQLTQKHQEYWSKNLRITAILLAIWFVVTFVIGYYARELNFNFFGWPFAFYMGAQGALIIYVVIIWYYARYMNNLDKQYDVHEGEE